MLLALHHEVDRYLTAKHAQGMSYDLYKSIKLTSQAPYYLHDRLGLDGRTESTVYFDLFRVVERLDMPDEGTDTVYAVLPRQYVSGRRRVFSAVTAIWLCYPPLTAPSRDPMWRVHTDQLIFLVPRPDVKLGEEVEASLVWSEDT